MDEKCRLPNESCWLKDESQYEAPSIDSMEWSNFNVTPWYRETFRMAIVLEDLSEKATLFSAGKLPLCRSCFDRTFNYVQKARSRCQSDAQAVQKFLKDLPKKFAAPVPPSPTTVEETSDKSGSGDERPTRDVNGDDGSQRVQFGSYTLNKQQLDQLIEFCSETDGNDDKEISDRLTEQQLEELYGAMDAFKLHVESTIEELQSSPEFAMEEAIKENGSEDEDLRRFLDGIEVNQEDLDEKYPVNEQELEEMHKEIEYLQEHMASIKERQGWVRSDIDEELIKIRDLEFQEMHDVSGHEDLNHTLFSMMAESDYLYYLLSKPRFSPLVTISSTNRNFVYIVNNSRLSFDCCPEENLNWPEINSAWSILLMGMKAVENLLRTSYHKKMDGAAFLYNLKPMRGVSIIRGKGISHLLEGYGEAIENKAYLRAILAFAIYMKQICKISEGIIGPENSLKCAPVEMMFESIVRKGRGYNITKAHMQSVVVAIIKCAKLFQKR